MVIEVHDGAKPALPKRTLACSVVLLGLTVLLALLLVWGRTADPLGKRLAPEGWGISFRAPRQFLAGDAIHTRPGVALLFHSPPWNSAPATLAIWRIPGGYVDDAEAACALVLGEVALAAPITGAVSDSTLPPPVLGPADAVERSNASSSRIVRAVLLEAGEAYAVLLLVEGGTIDEHLYHLFDLTCRSVRYIRA